MGRHYRGQFLDPGLFVINCIIYDNLEGIKNVFNNCRLTSTQMIGIADFAQRHWRSREIKDYLDSKMKEYGLDIDIL